MSKKIIVLIFIVMLILSASAVYHLLINPFNAKSRQEDVPSPSGETGKQLEKNKNEGIEVVSLGLYSSLSLEEKSEFQFGEQPLYLYLEYENPTEEPVGIAVKEDYGSVLVETNYELPGGSEEAVKLWLQIARNVFLSVGEYEIQAIEKNSPEKVLGQIALKIVPPTAAIAKDGQYFTEIRNKEAPFIASAGVTNALTGENVPINQITDVIAGESYHIYFTLGNIPSERSEEYSLVYKLYIGEDNLDVSQLNAEVDIPADTQFHNQMDINAPAPFFVSEKQSVNALRSQSVNDAGAAESGKSYFQASLPLNLKNLEQNENINIKDTDRIIVKLQLLQSDDTVIHSGLMKLSVQKLLQ